MVHGSLAPAGGGGGDGVDAAGGGEETPEVEGGGGEDGQAEEGAGGRQAAAGEEVAAAAAPRAAGAAPEAATKRALKAPPAFVALEEAVAALSTSSSTPTPARRSSRQQHSRPADRTTGERDDKAEGRRGGGDGGKQSSGRGRSTASRSRSPTTGAVGAVVWEALNPFTNDIGYAGPSSRSSSLSSVSTLRKQASYQPSTFKEMMTGMKESPAGENSNGDPWQSPVSMDICEDDDAGSRYNGGVEDSKVASKSSPKTPNIRKLAAAQSIWGTGVDDDRAARRVVSGRYRRVNGQYRSQSVQPRAADLADVRSEDHLVVSGGQDLTLRGRGPLGKPSMACETTIGGKPKAMTGKTGKTAAAAAAAVAAVGENDDQKPRKRGKSIGRRISRMFGRKTAVN